MKQIICLLISVLVCSTAVLTQDAKPTKSVEVSQSGRIINGPSTFIEGLRYPLSMWVNRIYNCGASIITTSHALTAAHCVYSSRTLINPALMILVGGTSYLNNPLVQVGVTRVAAHPNYTPTVVTSYYDVAVLTVPTNAFAGKPNMAPIALQIAEVAAGTSCFVVGWGWFDNNIQQPSNNLRYTFLNTITDSSCSLSQNSRISFDQICGVNGNNIDVCKGDSGGALVCGGRLTGIVSYGPVPCTSAKPTVFTKVMGPNIRNFIRSQAGI
ncbi:trypsin beta-like [Anopheles maculipalpis]|uniref:trypsin beta-like n=1 Tax=Anopheles maculipalpis TaxID=1496333 RepID=UPI002159017F|nr:trypsin beta-like [Anopheles maculipalpis]